MRKILAFIMTLVFTMSIISGCSAAENTQNTNTDFVLTMQIGNPNMNVNGTEKPINTEGVTPVIINGRTLLPVRAVVEEMGGTVNWDSNTQTATLNYATDEIKLTIDSMTATLNNAEQTLDAAPTIVNGSTMLPIRFIAESFKFNVDWDASTQIVTIKKSVDSNVNETATENTSENTNTTSNGKALVVYYSATGSTESVANYIVSELNADILKLQPVKPYTDDDLNWTDKQSRVVYEHENEDERNVELETTTVTNWDEYDTVFIGYPIWWGIAAWPVDNFVKSNDFTGKTVIPFCTSASSGLGESGELLQQMAGTGDWQKGIRFRSSASQDDVIEWLNSLND